MQIDPSSHLLTNVDYMPSPNMDDRPEGTDINLLVLHSISLPPGEFGGPWIEQLFTNQLSAGAHPYFEEICQLELSTHVLIKRSGGVVQFVPFNKRAWHAGESCYEGIQRCNDFSIGIELEGTDTGPFEDVQYTVLADVVDALCSAFPSITAERIAGHSDIAPGRKADPGTGFDWNRLASLLKAAH